MQNFLTDAFPRSNRRRKANLIETDYAKEPVDKVFRKFLKTNNVGNYSGQTFKKLIFAKTFIKTNRNLLHKPVFENGDTFWLDFLRNVTKKSNIAVPSPKKQRLKTLWKTKNLLLIESRWQKDLGNTNFKVGDLVKTAVTTEVLSNMIQLIGTNSIQIEKWLALQYKLIIHTKKLKGITKPHWKSQR